MQNLHIKCKFEDGEDMCMEVLRFGHQVPEIDASTRACYANLCIRAKCICRQVFVDSRAVLTRKVLRLFVLFVVRSLCGVDKEGAGIVRVTCCTFFVRC